MNKLFFSFRNLSLYKKIYIPVILSFFCMLIIFLAEISILTKSYNSELYETNARLMSQVSSLIDTRLRSIEDIADRIISDTTIQNALSKLTHTFSGTHPAVLRRDIYESLYPYSYADPYIHSINIVIDKNTNICMGNSSTLELFDTENGHLLSSESQGRIQWIPPKKESTIIGCIRSIREIKHLSLKNMADLYILVDFDALINDALNELHIPWEEDGFIFRKNNKILYPAAIPQEWNIDRIAEQSLSDVPYQIQNINNKLQFIIHGTLDKTDWNYIFFINYNNIFRHIEIAVLSEVLLIILLAVLMIFVLRLIFLKVFKQLKQLTVKIRKFGEDGEVAAEPKDSLYEDRTDELGVLYRTFDEMTKNVKELRDENYDKQILLRDATIQMLQQQINPHFLYNTLDTINCMAQLHGVEDISVMSLALANLFRVSITKSNDLISLSDEINILENYIRIQKIRFRERLQFVLDIPESFRSIDVPKLCIQPLVENAMKHAMDYSDEPCTIRVTLTPEDDDYIITVSNTGSRFEDDLLQRIDQQEIKPQGTGVGLANINSRLCLLFGDDYGLKFYNENDTAIVMLTIPRKKN